MSRKEEFKLLVEHVREYLKDDPTAGRHKIKDVFDVSESVARRVMREIGTPRGRRPSNVTAESFKPKPSAALGETIEEDLQTARVSLREKQADTATARYKKLLTRAVVEEQVIDEFRSAVEEALATGNLQIELPKQPKKADKPGQDEEAVLVISDSHVGKVVSPDHTLGFGHYNPRIFLDRLKFVESTVIRLLSENVANPISRLNILFLGDLVEGSLNHAQEIPNRWLVADQVLLASIAFHQFITRISAYVPEIVCRGVGGNHARWANQKKVPTENRYSNFDFIVMGQIAALIEATGQEHVHFDLEENAFQVFDLKTWRFKVGHGDHLRGGDAALGIPAHSIGREQNATTQRFAARGERPPDYYIVGDKHRPFVGPTATGRYMINGAWFADDEFALNQNFCPCRPFQLFFGVHPKHGKSWSYDLNLDAGQTFSDVPYTLPARLLKHVEKH